MLANWTRFKKRLYSFEGKYYCVLLAILIGGSVSLIGWQYSQLIDEINNDIKKELSTSKSEIDEALSSYNALLRVSGNKIVERNIANDPKAVSALLKQFYISSNGKTSAKIHLLDINWKGNTTEQVNRYGTLAAIELPKEVENAIRALPKKAYLFNITNNARSNDSTMLLTVGMVDSNKIYVGRLTVIADFSSWVEDLKEKIAHSGLVAAIIDKENKVVFASDKEINSLESSHVTFTQTSLLEPYNYRLVYGYNKQYFSEQLTHRILAFLSIFWAVAIAFAVLQFFYKQKYRARIKQAFNQTVTTLKTDNRNLTAEKESIKNELSSLTDKVQADNISEKERSKFEALISNRMSASSAELKEMIKMFEYVYDGASHDIANSDIPSQQLSKIQSILNYLSAGCAVKDKSEAIDLSAVIDESRKLFTKEIYKFSINIKINIAHDIKPLEFDRLLFKQLFANLLRQSILSVRSKGTIEINAEVKLINACEYLVITIRNDGFGLSDDYAAFNDAIKHKSKAPLSLDLTDIKKLIKSLGGVLDIGYSVEQGNTTIFSLPYIEKKPELIEGSNVVLLRKG